MVIYTSYFAKMRKYPQMEFVSVARFLPKGINIPTIYDLVPSEQLITAYKSGQLDEKEYARIYQNQLKHIDRNKLGEMLQGKCIACFEKPQSFCHRHIIAEWFREVGYEVEELE